MQIYHALPQMPQPQPSIVWCYINGVICAEGKPTGSQAAFAVKRINANISRINHNKTVYLICIFAPNAYATLEREQNRIINLTLDSYTLRCHHTFPLRKCSPRTLTGTNSDTDSDSEPPGCVYMYTGTTGRKFPRPVQLVGGTNVTTQNVRSQRGRKKIN